MKKITKRQEEALKLVHHDFEGLEEVEAAERMGITQQAVSRLLARLKEIAPQFFPIMTKYQAQCYHYLTCDGWSPKEVAAYLDRSIWSVYQALQACGRKGWPLPKAHGDIMEYTEDMDSEVMEKF